MNFFYGLEVIFIVINILDMVLVVERYGFKVVLVDLDFDLLVFKFEFVEFVVIDKIVVILVVYLYGKWINLDKVFEVVYLYGLYVLEDCVELF